MTSKDKSKIQNFADDYLKKLKRILDQLDREGIEKATDLIMEAYKAGRQIFIFGDGGSASTASHFACDLSKGTLQRVYDEKERRFRVISLTDNVALMTALANDLSFDDIFIQQLRNLVQKNDVVIAISGSGNSPNVIKALKYAREQGAKTIGFLGFKTGGKAAKLVDVPIIVQSNHYGRIEDAHLILEHLITSCIAEVKEEHDNRKKARKK